jgi:hypothetical protein
VAAISAINLGHHLGVTPAEGGEVHSHPVKPIQVGIGSESAVEDELLRQPARALLPELDEGEDLVVLLVFAHGGVGVAEHPRVGILGQKRQHSLLATAALGDVMLLHQRFLAVEGDGVEVQVEADAPGQPHLADGVKPQAHQLAMRVRMDAATVLGEEAALGDHVQPGEQSQPFIEDVAHHMAVTSRAEQKEEKTFEIENVSFFPCPELRNVI